MIRMKGPKVLLNRSRTQNRLPVPWNKFRRNQFNGIILLVGRFGFRRVLGQREVSPGFVIIRQEDFMCRYERRAA
jgi:hypothetical protein